MADDWPFLHLNLLSPNPSLAPNHSLDPSLNAHELNRQLEAWSNINFNFDLDPTPDPPISSLSSYRSHHSSEPLPDQPQPSFDQLFGFSHRPNHKLYPHPQTTETYVLPALTTLSPTTLPNHTQIPTPQAVMPSSSLGLADPADQGTELTSDSPVSSVTIGNSLPVPQAPANPQPIASPPTKTSHTDENKHDQAVDQTGLDDDEANKIAVEDDKRRRNTLASARFRMKKKMKEQEIERTAQEMKERVSELEKEVETLKQENKWLRGLIVEQAATKVSIPATLPTPELDIRSESSKTPPPSLSVQAVVPFKRDSSDDQSSEPARPKPMKRSNPKPKKTKIATAL